MCTDNLRCSDYDGQFYEFCKYCFDISAQWASGVSNNQQHGIYCSMLMLEVKSV